MSAGLYEHQLKAISQMHNGCILNGGVGSGKSRASLGYYCKEQGAALTSDRIVMKKPKNLFIITTARKRDTKEWEGDMVPFGLSTNDELNTHDCKVIVDSWNNIKKYIDVKDSFFIFDEQRVVGYGLWTKSFLKITRSNDWILLSATPGDTWNDYIPVFVANGFYKNKSEFIREHVEYDPYVKNFPKIKSYHNIGRLNRLRNSLLIDMDIERDRVIHSEDIYCNFNSLSYKNLIKERWNWEKEQPIENASELCYMLRKIVNSSPERIFKIQDIFDKRGRIIIFYNYDYELELLKEHIWGDAIVAEWNGHKHQPVPNSERWVYLVQYNAGAEGWNCITTDTIIFYSQNYSYKMMEQAMGRIDRINTPFKDLYYYHLKSRSGIDVAISKALKEKKTFNESRFVNG